MPTVLLVRHATTPITGQVLYGRSPGVSISEEGQRQAQAAADWIASRKPRAVYASPLERAQETAAPIASAAKREVQTVDGLNEIDFGDWTNRKLAALRKRKDWSQVQRTPARWQFPAGESFRAAQQRGVDAVEALAAGHTDKQTIVCVSHADLIKAVMAHYLGTPLDNFQRIHVSPASISEVVLPRGGGPFVVRVNHVPYGR